MTRGRTQVDTRTLKYVLYARKSTEDEGSQMRSIGDQIKDCQKLAERDGLQIVDSYKKQSPQNGQTIARCSPRSLRTSKPEDTTAFYVGTLIA